MTPARLVRVAGPPMGFLVALGVAWELWAVRSTARNPVLPPPSRIFDALVRNRSLLIGHVRTTLAETALGVGVGVTAGLLIAVLISAWALPRRTLGPLLVISQTVPVQVLAPLLVLWFGFGLTPKIIVVALIVFFPVAVSTATGLQHADRDLADLVRSYGAGRMRLLRMVLAPAAIPGLFSGLRISLTYAVAGAVISESIGASSGLGLYIERSRRAFRYDQVFAGITVVVVLSIALFSLTYVLSRLATPWLHLEEKPS